MQPSWRGLQRSFEVTALEQGAFRLDPALRGRCPGCSHQWRHTSCLACAKWSRHDDWYEPEPGKRRTG